MIPWAEDRWFGLDKLEHFVWCYAGWLTMSLLGWGVWWKVGVLAVAAIAVEIVQWVRWDIWNNEKIKLMDAVGPEVYDAPPRPAFADQPSYRDLAWDAAGALAAVLSWGLA